MPDGQGGAWVTLAEAARRLDRAPDTLRKKAKAGKLDLPARQDNHGVWHILLPDVPAMPAGDAGQAVEGVPDGPAIDAGIAGLLAERDARIADLEGRLADVEARAVAREVELATLRERVAQQDRIIGERDARIADALAERDRLLTMLDETLAERRQPERRPWPGLRAWWRRVWEGEERSP